MNRISLAFLLALLWQTATAQRITKYEYWIDSHAEERVSMATQSGNLELQLDLADLANGLHTIAFRAQDERGRWSYVTTDYFLKVSVGDNSSNARIKSYEYWIDSKDKERIAVQTDNSHIELMLDLHELADGLHTMAFRVQDDQGRWSSTTTEYFLKVAMGGEMATRMKSYEYWIDNHLDKKVTGTTTDGIISFTLDATQLRQGLHTLSFRSCDVNDRWSSPFTEYFLVTRDSKNEVAITNYRYWYNDNYSDATEVTLEKPAQAYILKDSLPTNNLLRDITPENITTVSDENGKQQLAVNNTLNVMFCDANKTWSSVMVDTFAVSVGTKIANLTAFVKNPEADEQWKYWKTEGQISGISDENHWTGKPQNLFVLGNPNRSQWTTTMKQTINGLPAGTYYLTARGMATESATLMMNVNGFTADFPSTDASRQGGELWQQAPVGSDVRNANDGMGFGWAERTVVFTTDGSAFDIVFTAQGNSSDQYAYLDNIELTVNGKLNHDKAPILKTIQLVRVEDASKWNEYGTTVPVRVRGSYVNDNGLTAHLYYTSYNGSNQRADVTLQPGKTFEAVVNCVFKSDADKHVLHFYAKDENEDVSVPLEIEINNLNTSFYIAGVPDYAVYTGNPITLEGVSLYNNVTGEAAPSTQYTISYRDNVNDGKAWVEANGVFPYSYGKAERPFTIHSYIDKKEIEILRTLQSKTQNSDGWYYAWNLESDQILSDELWNVKAYNTHIQTINLSGNNLWGEMPNYLFSLPELESLDLSNNQLSGEIKSELISDNLKKLYLYSNHLTSLSAPLPETVTEVSLGYQEMDVVADCDLSDPSVLARSIPNICVYNPKTRTFDQENGINLYEEDKSNQIGLYLNYFSDGSHQMNVYNWHEDYLHKSGEQLWGNDKYGNSFLMRLHYSPGDVNFTGTVDVIDLSALIYRSLDDYISLFNRPAGNLWNDSIINVQDAVCLVNILLDNPSPSSGPTPRRMASSHSAENEEVSKAILTIEGKELVLTTDSPISAFDIMLEGATLANVKSLLGQKGITVSMRQQDNGVRLIGYIIQSGKELPVGTTALAQIKQTNVSVSAAMLADEKAQEVNMNIGGVTGIGDMVSAQPLRLATRDGQLVAIAQQPVSHVSWSIRTVGGMLVAQSIDCELMAGENILSCELEPNSIYIVNLTSDNDNLTRKIKISK